MNEIVPLGYYKFFYHWVLFVICALTSLYYAANPGCVKLYRQNTIVLPLLFTIILIYYIGMRECSWLFWDMMLYRHMWLITDPDTYEFFMDFRREWFFYFIIATTKKIAPDDVHFFFLTVAIIYIVCQFWACKKLLWENVWMAILFIYFSFQFYPFATNGIRNGMGAALAMLAIAFFCDRNKMGYIVGSILFILAFGCHRSLIVPITALAISLFVIKDIKWSIYIWLVCIFVSFFSGGTFLSLMSGLGFDDRMSSYSEAGERTMSQFSRTGFRWDFLLYSAMPVWLAWYARHKGVLNRTFTLLANTYIIANSFWIMVCRVAYSNRFAYLSWFLYALVIAYAAIRLPIWKNQDRAAGYILLAHSGFTILMYIVG